MPDGVHDVPTPEEAAPPHEASLRRAPLKFQALRRALGAGYGAIADLGVAAGEVVPVALESVVGQGARVTAYTAGLTDFDSLATEFAGVDHLGFELQVAFSECEVSRVGLLVPLASAGTLFAIDVSRKRVDPGVFATPRISERLTEFLDLLCLTLFTDGLTGTEVTLANLHGGRAEWTLGLVRDVAQDAAPARLDVVMTLDSGATAQATLIAPVSLLARLAAGLPSKASSAPSAFDGESTVNAGMGSEADGSARAVPSSAFPWFEVEGLPARSIEVRMDASMRVSVELGGSSMTAEEILELGPGSVVELNKLAAEPVDIVVNDRLIARGEVLVVDEKFGVRITEISSPRQRVNAIER